MLNQKGIIAPIIIILGLIMASVFVAAAFYFFKSDSSQNSELQPKETIENKQGSVTTTTNETRKEDVAAIKGDYKLTYLFNPQDNKSLILKSVDFKTRSMTETVLPFVSRYNKDEKLIGRYIFSPDYKYVLKLKSKSLEIAELPKAEFKQIFTVPPVTDPKYPDTDFANLSDAMWDKNGNLFFNVSVGLDGRENPPGVPYTDVYVAEANGANYKLVNDHTKEDQKYGFRRTFYAIDTEKNEIYLSGTTHGGHYAAILKVDAQTAVLKETLRDISNDLGNPVFNNDFSKAYFQQDQKEEGYSYPVKLYEYDFNSKSKRVIYTVPNVTDNYDTPQIDNNIGLFIFDNNRLYFQVRDKSITRFYSLDPNAEKPEQKLLFDDSGDCTRIGVSANGEVIFLSCYDRVKKINSYYFYLTATSQRALFFADSVSGTFYNEDASIKVLEFN